MNNTTRKKKVKPRFPHLLISYGISFFIALLMLQASIQMSSAEEARPFLPYTAEYIAHLKNIPISGSAIYTLKKTGKDQFEMRSSAKILLGHQEEVSQFSWLAQNCHSILKQYTYDRNYLGKTKHYSLDFDWNTRHIRYVNKNQIQLLPLPALIEDSLTEQLAVRCQIKAGLQTVQLKVTRKNEVAQHTFKRAGEDILELPIGRYKAVRVIKVETKNDGKQTTLWFAPELDYLLVQLQRVENNSLYTLRLKNLHYQP